MSSLKMMSLLLAALLSIGGLTQAWFITRDRTLDIDINAASVANDECRAKAARGDCTFYSCFEERFPCGRNGYMMQYGLFYCNRFFNSLRQFDQGGQTFLNASRRCLMEALLPLYEMETVNCLDLSHAAFDSHSACYIDNGFCDVFWENREAYLRNLETSDIFDFRFRKMWREVFEVAMGCGGAFVRELLQWAASQATEPVLKPFQK